MTQDDGRRRALLDRIEQRLPAHPLREVPMFGAVAVMLDDSMVVAVHKDGSLLARVRPEDDAALLLRDGAARAEMGAGRSMGAGWIRVGGESLDDEGLDVWMRHALSRWERERRVPGRAVKRRV